MFRRQKPADFELVDRAKERMLMHAYMDKVKNVGLFILVALVLSWLVLGVL